jgi:hypothetical protein
VGCQSQPTKGFRSYAQAQFFCPLVARLSFFTLRGARFSKPPDRRGPKIDIIGSDETIWEICGLKEAMIADFERSLEELALEGVSTSPQALTGQPFHSYETVLGHSAKFRITCEEHRLVFSRRNDCEGIGV